MPRLLALLLLLVAPLAAQASSPAGPPDGTYRYSIEHSEHGKLGTQVITIATQGETRRVSADRRLKVERILVVVYRENTTIEELWRGGVLRSYSRRSDYGDKVTTLTATLGADGLEIDNDGQRATLPAGLMSTHFWNPQLVEQRQVFSTEDGSLLDVSVSQAGDEQLVVGGQRLTATRFEMTGGERRTFWFDDQGRLLRMDLHRGGGEVVTFQLERLPG
jgi:hypothetical protein